MISRRLSFFEASRTVAGNDTFFLRTGNVQKSYKKKLLESSNSNESMFTLICIQRHAAIKFKFLISVITQLILTHLIKTSFLFQIKSFSTFIAFHYSTRTVICSVIFSWQSLKIYYRYLIFREDRQFQFPLSSQLSPLQQEQTNK